MSPAGSSNAPEARAGARIDQALTEAGRTLQDRDDMNLAAGDAIAVREFKLERGHGYVDHMLFLDGYPLGVREAKPAGSTLTSVEPQGNKYSEGVPSQLLASHRPLPFVYLSTGDENGFYNFLDPSAHALPPAPIIGETTFLSRSM
jgi:type I restriction enzyme R subunit